ncbi:hypothetical protein CERSUDRAFT_118045 [Gelatoporia subvermispora B]|uniref:DUF6534 domain-containing protein n=1 Tax=Ceriporiopsis subvermispora (strain B) TaxID=914234 RepID=M2R5P6_CERS8|nr:hypothetical protein CERSUDRAFT_118045 [Gelatoporia subvermispora B]
MVTSAVYGISISQTYVYFHSNNKDSALFRALIAVLWMMDTFHQILICSTIYMYTVTDFGNIFALDHQRWGVISVIPLSAVMYSGIRGVFCYRIWLLSNKNRILVAPIMFCSLGELGFVTAFAVQSITVAHSQFLSLRKLASTFYVGVSFTIIADSLVAISMVVLLWKRRSKVRRTDSIVRTLIIYSVNTGLLTTACAIAELITWVAAPNDLIYLVFFAALPTLFFNALLAMLNARQDLRHQIQGADGIITLPLSAIAPSHSRGSTQVGHVPFSEEPEAIPIEIKIQRADELS